MKLPFDVDLSGKVAVITGGGGVLCGQFAKALASCGAKIALVDLNPEAMERVAKEIREDSGATVGCYAASVLERESMEQAAQKIHEELGKCSILINGAGGNNPRATTDKEYFEPGDLEAETKSFFNLDQSGVQFVFNLNFIGTLVPTQVFAQDMVEGGGNIINVSSMNAYTPLTKIPAYSGAKAAISNFTQWLAVHFSRVGIRVNAIAPGFFSTAQNASLLWNPDGTPTARTGKILAATPMGRFGTPDELIGALLYLVCDAASGFVTGTVMPVDGGFSAYSGV